MVTRVVGPATELRHPRGSRRNSGGVAREPARFPLERFALCLVVVVGARKLRLTASMRR